MSVFGWFSMSADQSQIYFSPLLKHVSQFSVDFIKIQMDAEISQQWRKLLWKMSLQTHTVPQQARKCMYERWKKRKRKFFEDERREKWGNSIMAFCLLIFPFSRYILFSKRKMWLPENSVFPFIQWNNFFSSLWKINEILLIFQTYFEIHLNFPWDFPFWNGFSQSPKLY